ncbi:MAG: hypothetical protein U0324_43285 [Polyangiales bacterium]
MTYPPDIDDANHFLDVRRPVGVPNGQLQQPRRIFSIRSPNNRGIGNNVGHPVISITQLTVKSTKTGVVCPQTYDTAPGVIASASQNRFRFVPGYETLSIAWKLVGAEFVTDVDLEVYRRNDANPLWKKNHHWPAGRCPKVKSDTFNGEMRNTAPWNVDGRHRTVTVTPGFQFAEFPDGILTVEHAPYKLKVIVRNPGNATMLVSERWAFLDVVLDGLEFSWGPQNVIPLTHNLPTNTNNPVDRSVHAYALTTDRRDGDNLAGALPLPGQTKKVYLSGHSFYQSEAELEANSAWAQHHALWGEGPNLPILLTPGVSCSDGRRVVGQRAAAALGAMQFAWEWIDDAAVPGPTVHNLEQVVATNNALLNARTQAITFLQQALEFDRQVTEPPGRNCHVERGGKRGPNAPAVFPTQNGTGTFPFKVNNPATGNWCATSAVATTGVQAGKTGVVFQPSIQGGDGYKLRVVAIYDHNVDPTATHNIFHNAVDNTDAALKAELGTLQVWRDIEHTAFGVGQNGVPEDHLEALHARMKGAFIRVRTRKVSASRYFQAVERIHRGTLQGVPPLDDFVRDMLVTDGTYSARQRAVYDDSYEAWKQRTLNRRNGLPAARVWARQQQSPIRDYWRSGVAPDGMYPLCEPWPIDFVGAPLPNDGNAQIDMQVTPFGGVLQQHQVVIQNAQNPQPEITSALEQFFGRALANKPYKYQQDPNVTVTVHANGTQMALRHAFTGAVERYFDDRSKGQWERAVGYAWAFQVMRVAFAEVFVGVDGVRSGYFAGSATFQKGPNAKAMFSDASRASTDIYITPGSSYGTTLHEWGHELYVNHPHFDAIQYAQGDPRHLHDVGTTICTMKTPPVMNNFCGFCLLRLRGWSIYKLDPARVPEPIFPIPNPVQPDMHVRTLVETGAANTR